MTDNRSATEFSGDEQVRIRRNDKDSLAAPQTAYAVQAKPGRRYTVRQLATLLPNAFHLEPDLQARRLVNIGAHRGFDALRRENQAKWSEIWPARPIIRGAPEQWQALADASFYYLHASAHQSSLFSTAMFGLAYWPNYHYYRGHVMWDIESFAFPPILVGAPRTARAMLEYRLSRLTAARYNAAMNGYAGLQFPWESSPQLGEEVTPLLGTLVGLEQHVNFSVAQAFAQYFHVTADRDWAAKEAWPVVAGVCDWIASRAVETERGYEIKHVLGIAEGRPAPVDNDAYVNMAAIATLREGVGLGDTLGYDTSRWNDLAKRLFIPIDQERGVIYNHDRFSPSEPGEVGATPEALAGYLPGNYRGDRAVMERTCRFYLDRIEPYIGSPMLSAPLGVYASWIGDRERSARMFTEGYAEFMNDPYAEVNETSNVRMPDKPRASPLFANIGGFLTALYFGLPRLRISAAPIDRWPEGAVTMPAGWDGIEVERLWLRNRPVRMSAFHGDLGASIEPV